MKILNLKSEILNNIKIQNDFWVLVIGICLGFRN